MNNETTPTLAQRLSQREAEARTWVADQLFAFVEGEAPAILPRRKYEEWFTAMLAHHRFGTKPGYAHDSRRDCDTCGVAMEREKCEMSADPDDARVGYRDVCPCCGKGEDDQPKTASEMEDAA